MRGISKLICSGTVTQYIAAARSPQNEPAGPTDKAVPGKRSCRTLSTGGKLKNRMLRDACLTVGILVFGVAHPACPSGLPILKSPWVCRYYKFLFARKEDKPALRECTLLELASTVATQEL